MDSGGGVRANRMDQVFGAVCRALEVPGATNGIGGLYDLAIARGASGSERRTWAKITDGGQWAMSDYLNSAAIFLTLRAWANKRGDESTRALVADFLSHPEDYKGDRKRLYHNLVRSLQGVVYDPRPENQFYKDGFFTFTERGYQQSWEALEDLDKLAKVSGLRGLILLFDEFEDVVQNLNNSSYQQSAFVNLFRFFDGHRFPGMAYFAVTPEFAAKCKNELMSRQVYGFPVERFDKLNYFAMSRIQPKDLGELAQRIRSLHSIAYKWDAEPAFGDLEVVTLVGGLTKKSSQDQTRQAIIGIVEHLDNLLEDSS